MPLGAFLQSVTGGHNEVICAPLHLTSTYYQAILPSGGDDWTSYVMRSVETLLLAPQDLAVGSSRTTFQLPLVSIPAHANREEYLLESITKIIGINVSSSEVVFLNGDISDGVQLKYSRRRPLAIVLLKIRGNLSLSNGDRSCHPQLVPLFSTVSLPIGRQSGQVLERVTVWLLKECCNMETLLRMFTGTGGAAGVTTDRGREVRNTRPTSYQSDIVGGSAYHLTPRMTSGVGGSLERPSSVWKSSPDVGPVPSRPLSQSTESLFRKHHHQLPSVSNPNALHQHAILQQQNLPTTASLDRARSIDAPCDIVVTNPLRPARFTFSWKVDICVRNPFWLLRNMSESERGKIRRSNRGLKDTWFCNRKWSEDFPLHEAAWLGDAIVVSSLLGQGHLGIQRDRTGWAPLHYAAWYGHVGCLRVLLDESPVNLLCDPTKRSALHLAALATKREVVQLIIACKDVNLDLTDVHGWTALDLCEIVNSTESRRCADLIRACYSRPIPPKISVLLSDGTNRDLILSNGSETTVKQLTQQMTTVLDLPETCVNVFALWICSKNLQLQLKDELWPVKHMADWKVSIVSSLTDHDGSKEEPVLCWKRDAKLSVEEEKQIKDIPTLTLLFHETYNNYIRSLYPCCNMDIVVLGTLLLHVRLPPLVIHGSTASAGNQLQITTEIDTKKVKSFLANDRCLQTVVPDGLLKSRNISWSTLLMDRFKQTAQSYIRKKKQELQYRFLSMCWNLTTYGSAFFSASSVIKGSKTPVPVLVGVNDYGVHILHAQRKVLLQSFSYKNIIWNQEGMKPVIHIRSKQATKTATQLHTKQATLISHLMNKMCSLCQG